MQTLTQLQKKLCTLLQQGLPIYERSFDKVAADLGVSTDQVLDEIRRLKKEGIIKRFRAIINHRALGKAGTLVTAHVPEDKLNDVAESVNALPGVSHNYLRDHFYNLWFTLQAQNNSEIEQILMDLHERFSIQFHNLPVVRTFKLNVRFDITEDNSKHKNEIIPKPKDEMVILDDDEKVILSNLQKELEITERPFSFMSNEKLTNKDVLRITQNLIEKGIIRRIAAVIDYKEVGFTANVLFVCEVSQDRIIKAGENLASSDLVSHCYERKTFDGWPYNLFAMMHSQNMDEIRSEVNQFIQSESINSYQLLPTINELKKEPVKHIFD